MINSNYKIITALADKIAVKLTSYEIGLAIISLVGLALKISGIKFGANLLLISLLSLSALSMIMAYASPKEGSNPFDAFIFKSQAMGSSVTIIGILFLLLSWKGYSNMLTIGTLILTASIIYNLFKNQSLGLVLKPIILLAIGLILFFTPKETLQDLHIISKDLM